MTASTKRSLTWFNVLVAIAGALHPLGASAAPTTREQECVLVESADIRSHAPEDLHDIEAAHWRVDAGHRLIPGSRRILLVREMVSEVGYADAQKFTKITAVLADVDDPLRQRVDLTVGHFSSGYSGFAYRSDAWSTNRIAFTAAPLEGQKDIIRVSGSAIAMNPNRNDVSRFNIEIDCRVHSLLVGELTPWQGGEGSSFEFFYP